jgi:hypothetical protein
MLTPTEWPYVRAATLASGPRNGMNPLERVALYAAAIQTGLRSNELRSLTRVDLFLAGDKPYVRCRAENTKNKHEATQYIQADLAADLRTLVATKTPTANVFTMPNEWNVADMLRADLAAARKQWLDEMKHDPDARAKREESDFLAVTNDQGESLDFHSLRHTCGSWLALQGIQPNVIKTVMRHCSITLTMDTYGHLLPDQHADAVGGMASMMTTIAPLAATGTAGATAVGAAVAMRNGTQDDASECDAVRRDADCVALGEERKPLRIADVCETMQGDASSRGRIRTGTGVTPQGILSPQCLPFHHAAIHGRQVQSILHVPAKADNRRLGTPNRLRSIRMPSRSLKKRTNARSCRCPTSWPPSRRAFAALWKMSIATSRSRCRIASTSKRCWPSCRRASLMVPSMISMRRSNWPCGVSSNS